METLLKHQVELRQWLSELESKWMEAEVALGQARKA